MNDYSEFDAETREKLEEFDRLVALYKAQVEGDWQQKKEPQAAKTTPTDHYATPREIFQSCLKKTPNGGGYFALGEYYQKLNGR